MNKMKDVGGAECQKVKATKQEVQARKRSSFIESSPEGFIESNSNSNKGHINE
jgi:hypothetical protein